MFLHTIAISGNGRITKDTIAHTNMRVQDKGVVASAAPLTHVSEGEDTVRNTDILDAKALEELASMFACKDDTLEALLGDKDDGGNAGLQDAEDKPLTESDRQIVDGIPSPPPDACPLALSSIRTRLENIVRHLSFHGVMISADVCKDVNRITRYLASKKAWYPSGYLQKEWISDNTVSQLLVAVWNIAGQEHPAVGSRSVQNLLLIQTIIHLLDQCGP